MCRNLRFQWIKFRRGLISAASPYSSSSARRRYIISTVHSKNIRKCYQNSQYRNLIREPQTTTHNYAFPNCPKNGTIQELIGPQSCFRIHARNPTNSQMGNKKKCTKLSNINFVQHKIILYMMYKHMCIQIN